ncbi:GGDEF domain-containing protein [Roseateles amylovorans]|uniref:Bacterial transcriptional activator domain-containing protein n=1 Tax=Roseateles amylovorans TaxID=2978473 RepID=A0ABY6B2Q7_9BURK|nr:hypothetical protein [Roseateles amylovorans]UXH77808.1 hypothetical protein N4261_22995 [Roseateles amylovorans]
MNPDKVLRSSPGTLGDLELECADTRRLIQDGQLDVARHRLDALQHAHGEAHAPLQELLSVLAEAHDDWPTALRHYKRFHALAMQAGTSPLASRDQLLAKLVENQNTPDMAWCLVALSAAKAPAGALPQMLRQQCRAHDVLALGKGEAMLMLLHDVDLPTGRKVCERIRTVWFQQHLGAGPVSMGLTAWRGPGDTGSAFLNRAEGALDRSQREGGPLRTG